MEGNYWAKGISTLLPPECRDILVRAYKDAQKAGENIPHRIFLINEAEAIVRKKAPKRFISDEKSSLKRKLEAEALALTLAEDGASIEEIMTKAKVSRYIAKKMIATALGEKAKK